MTSFDQMSLTEQAMLLGFIPILGATSHAGSALAAAVIGIVTAYAVRGVSLVVPSSVGGWARWAILVAVSFGLTFGLTAPAQFVVPIPGSVLPYVMLVSVTPIVYVGAGSRFTSGQFHGLLFRYAVLLLVFALIREPLGQATLLEYALWDPSVVPIGLFRLGSGGLFLFAAIACVARVRAASASKRAEVTT